MKAEIKTKRYIHCPHCGRGEYDVEHLFGDTYRREFGPWPCKLCNHDFSGRVVGGEIEITEVREHDREPMLCLFRFRDLYLVVRGYSKPKDAKSDWYDYLFHSHQCPINMLRKVDEIYCPSEGNDTHGLLRFIAAIPDPGEIKYDRGYTTLESIFRLFQTDGTEAPTRWPEHERGLLPGLARLQDEYAKSKAAKA